MLRILIFIILFISCYNANCQENNYLITKSNKVNIRTGPDFRYAIKYTYIKKGTVLKIKNIFEDWYLVQDLEGDEGWAYKNLVTSSKKLRFVSIKVKNDVICYKKPSFDSKPAFKASYLTNFKLKSCKDSFCLVEKDGLSGWCERDKLWGL